ncbi:fatty acid desaturase family protein [Granulicella paludicola]|uniref:fatty acid desaturase family protein n=1 Tax=Granulicella paludicola TaxID=474951 RepID=UPI0021E0363F|nr:fatty acid desaturase [Granulicella paludicola]
MISEVNAAIDVQAGGILHTDSEDLVPSEAVVRLQSGAPIDLASFPKVLRSRLDSFFAATQTSPKADGMMWSKIGIGLVVLAGSWTAIYAFKLNSWAFMALYILSGLAQTFLLLNIAHDSNHNAISSRSIVNKTLNYAFDLCGINSYMWRILHHRGHHSCVNVHGEDDALTGRGLLRFTPYEPRTSLQRFQHVYALALYAVFSLDYVFVRDFECFFRPAHDYIERTKHPAREYVILFASKAFYLTYMLILPIFLLHRAPLLVIGSFLLVHMIVGLSVALVFQTTHTIDSTYFPAGRGEFDNGVYHIFATTADYATANPVVSWLTGGLNHHIVHHLCPFVCHTHYAPLTRIVEETAAEFGVPYRQHPTMTKAIWHHLILLKQLGTAD